MTPEDNLYHVFCDESHLADNYRVQGGIWVPGAGMRAVREAFRALRTKHPQVGEFKWTRVGGETPRANFDDLIGLFFDPVVGQLLQFKCIVVARQDDPTSNHNAATRDIGFYKAYYTLLRWRLQPGASHHIKLDQKSSPNPDPDTTLRRALRARGREVSPPFSVLSLKSVDSKSDDLLQLADVLCGLVGWAWNGRKSTCGAKPAIENKVAKALGWSSLQVETHRSASKFNIWRYRPRKR